MDHTSQSTHWSRAADMIQQEANDAKRALTKAQARIAELEKQNSALAEALVFYADPMTYFAIAFVPDSPAGDFMDDFEDTEQQNVWEPLGVKPGKRARQALVTKPQEAEAEKNCPHGSTRISESGARICNICGGTFAPANCVCNDPKYPVHDCPIHGQPKDKP